MDPAEKNAILNAYASASRSVFILNVPFIAICLIGCLLIKDRGLQRPNDVKQSEPAQEIEGEAEKSLEQGNSSVSVVAESKADFVVEESLKKKSEDSDSGPGSEGELRQEQPLQGVAEPVHPGSKIA